MRHHRFATFVTLSVFCLFAGVSASCSSSGSSTEEEKKPEVTTPTLNIAITNYSITATDRKLSLTIKASNSYTVKSKSSWVIPITSDPVTYTTFDLTINENTSYMERTDTLYVTMGTKIQNVYITQAMKTIPSIAADQSGMTDNAMTVTHQINVGWNLGNTCESNNGNYKGDFQGSETYWGNPITTQTMITAVKNAGFNAIRVPVCWGAHISDKTSWTIDATWMARIKEIVDYAYNQGMYIILNSHHDGWFEFDCNAADSTSVRQREVAMWIQIALTFRDYDERLIFAGMNEPHEGNDWNAPSSERAKVHSYYEQKFVDAVRSTGGKNAYRCLMVQSWCCNPSYYNYFSKPTDTATNRLIYEFHYYNPWNFCGTDDASCVRFWGDTYKQYGAISTYGTADMIKNDFNTLKTNYIDKGIPVIMGEFGVNRHTFTGNEITNGTQAKGAESREYYLKWLASTAHSYGIPLFYWDNGALGTVTNSSVLGSGSDSFGIFNRKSSPAMTIYDAGAVKAIIEGAKTAYP